MSQPNHESGPGAGPADPYGPGYTNPYGPGYTNPYGPGYSNPYGPGYSNPYGPGSSNPYGTGYPNPYGTGYTFSTPTPPPPPHRRRRAGVLVALSLIAAFVVGVAGAEVGRYATTADAVPTGQATKPDTGTPTAPSRSPSPTTPLPGAVPSTGGSSSVAAIIDPALVDIVSTFSYQRASGAGTGIVLSASG